MSQEKPVMPPDPDAPAANYFLLCLSGCVLLFLALMQRGMGMWGVLPPLIGIVGAWLRWRISPVLVLVLLVGLLYAFEPFGQRTLRGVAPPRNFRLPDWILSGAVLAYAAGHFRLQGLGNSMFPADARQEPMTRQELLDPAELARLARVKRDPLLAKGAEIAWLVVLIPVWALIAQLCWRMLPPVQGSPQGIRGGTWQAIVAVWVLALVLYAASGILRYITLQSMSQREARLLLQDTLWLETSRDQRRVNRWLAWAASRVQRSANKTRTRLFSLGSLPRFVSGSKEER